MVTKFYQILEARRRRRAFVNIRREFEKAGYPLDHFRDSQIEAAVTRWTDDIAQVTLNAKTIYRAVKRLRRLASGDRMFGSRGEALFHERVNKSNETLVALVAYDDSESADEDRRI